MSIVMRVFLASLFLWFLSSTVGCGDDERDPVAPEAPAVRYAENATELVGLLETAIDARDGDAYERLVHPDFRFEFSLQDVDLIGRVDMDRDVEIATVRTMFSEEPFGDPLLALESLAVISMGPVEGWETVFPGSGFRGANRRAVYEARIEARFSTGSIGVSGRWELFTTTERIDVDGVPTTVTRLVGWRDLGIALRSSDTESWGGLKSLYLTDVD